MSENVGQMPEPQADPEPERAPGGPDAFTAAESDVGAASGSDPVLPDSPLSAQQDEDKVPDELQEPERPEPAEQETDNTDAPSS